MECTYFDIRELICPPTALPPRLLAVYQSRPRDLFRMFPWRFLAALDGLRKFFGPATVNNWWWYDKWENAPYQYSGYRPMGCTVGADLSEHRFCRAGDLKFAKVTPSEVWGYMAAHPEHPAFEHVERIEAYTGMTWVHFDLGQHARNGEAIRVFTPTDNRAGLPEYIMRPR